MFYIETIKHNKQRETTCKITLLIIGIKLLTRPRVGLSHLYEHKFHHNFNDTINPFCLCGPNEIEPVEHYLLHCPIYTIQRTTLLNSLCDNDTVFILHHSVVIPVLSL